MTATLEAVQYTGKAHTTGGRDGASRSSDGRLDIKLSSPGRPGNGTNPEQLFAAGWSACFMGAMGLAAARLEGPAASRDRHRRRGRLCATSTAPTSFRHVSMSACRAWSAAWLSPSSMPPTRRARTRRPRGATSTSPSTVL